MGLIGTYDSEKVVTFFVEIRVGSKVLFLIRVACLEITMHCGCGTFPYEDEAFK